MATTFTVDALNQITSTIIAGGIKVHRALGPGLLENAYLACLCQELTAVGLRFEAQKPLPLIYNATRIECAYRADLSSNRQLWSRSKLWTRPRLSTCASFEPTHCWPIAASACC